MPLNNIKKTILVIPSLDILDGKLVRVVQGIPQIADAQYPDDPIEMAKIWRAENAKCLHIVNLNAAWEQAHDNTEIIFKILSQIILPVQVGGGLRSYKQIKDIFERGAARVVIGSIAVNDQYLLKEIISEFGSDRILISIDSLNNKVIIKGRKITTDYSPAQLINELKPIGIKRVILTDIERNGMLTGPNFDLLKEVAQKTNIKITASGGVNDLNDLLKLNEMLSIGVDSVIIGRALYENHFNCQKLWRKAEKGTIVN